MIGRGLIVLIAALVLAAPASAATPVSGAPFKVSFLALQDAKRPDRLRLREISVNHLRKYATVWYFCEHCGGPLGEQSKTATASRSRHVFRSRKLVATRKSVLNVEVSGSAFARRRVYRFRPSQARLVLTREYCYNRDTYKTVPCELSTPDLWATMSSCEPTGYSIQTEIPPVGAGKVNVTYSLQYLQSGTWLDVAGVAAPFVYDLGGSVRRFSHTFGALDNAAGRTFRGAVDIEWGDGLRTRLYTSEGQPVDLATSVPPGLSVASCTGS